MQKRKKRNNLVLAFACIFFVLLQGCSEEHFQANGVKSFSEGVRELESIYAKGGISASEIQRIDSSELFDEKEIASFSGKLSGISFEIESLKVNAASVQNLREREALLSLLLVEKSRIDYLKALAEFKETGLFREAARQLDSFDFNAIKAIDGKSCPEIPEKFFEKYSAADLSNEKLKADLQAFTESFPEFVQSSKISEKTPRFQSTWVAEFAELSLIASRGCGLLKEATELLSIIEAAAGEQSVCLNLKLIGEKTLEFNALVLKIDSFVDRTESFEGFAFDAGFLKAEKQALLSVAEELSAIQSQMELECG
ncbi:MAG: hypothetical protein QXK06_04135 [Candidatus Diapherotrites archaeon]